MFKDDKNIHEQQLPPFFEKRKRKSSSAKKAIALAPFILGLSLLAGTPQAANAVQQEANPSAKIRNEHQTTHYETQLEKGTRRINAFIEMLESEFYEDGTTRKSEAVLQSHSDIANAMKEQDAETFDKYADGIEIYPISTKNYSLLIANGEIIRCYTSEEDLTEQLKRGERKVAEQIEKYLSDTDEWGRIKSEEEKEKGLFFAQALKGYLNSPKDLKSLTQQKPTSLSAVEQARANIKFLREQEDFYRILDRNIYFLSEIIKDENDFSAVYHDVERSMLVNSRYLTVFERITKEGFVDITFEKQEFYRKYFEEHEGEFRP